MHTRLTAELCELLQPLQQSHSWLAAKRRCHSAALIEEARLNIPLNVVGVHDGRAGWLVQRAINRLSVAMPAHVPSCSVLHRKLHKFVMVVQGLLACAS